MDETMKKQMEMFTNGTIKRTKELEEAIGMKDNVNHPSHYETGKFECIDVMLETQGEDSVKNFCLCNAFKYLYRHNGKNQDEDIRKAQWYINKYLEIVDGNTDKT